MASHKMEKKSTRFQSGETDDGQAWCPGCGHGNIRPWASKPDGKKDGRYDFCEILLLRLVAPSCNAAWMRSANTVRNNGRAWSGRLARHRACRASLRHREVLGPRCSPLRGSLPQF